ncbi:hypothetical protein Poli38472_011499 [Pythium oligandrum]|uniref:Peptidase S1 domain-containing protein n=1 Tax=Pythium oligandrum TaxID=41045 RepID=A0A8K1FKW6_PYTOL|nr:hypothetical protein Poli38472_011499 [Pythium oligandrum]|eukprot:TMW64619.1 hypothetical protein Poli38472_011499 [Pythium oligandrum]
MKTAIKSAAIVLLTIAQLLRSNVVDVLEAGYCPKELRERLDGTTTCVNKKICYGDYGRPVVKDAWSSSRVLFGVIGNDFYCRNKHDYNVVGRVSAVADWITETMNKFN